MKEAQAILCRILVPLPPGYPTFQREVSLAHPDLRFRVVSITAVGADALGDVSISGDLVPEGLFEEVRRSVGVRQVELLSRSERSLLLRITLRMAPGLKGAVDLGIPLMVPYSFDNGVVRVVFSATPDKVRRYYDELKRFAPDAHIESIRREAISGPKSLLTPHQVEVFQKARTAGYWDVPRRTSLTRLAESLHVSKSTLSETLATIESRLLHDVGEEHLYSLPL